jgi:type I restriction enzyme R subunit
MPSPGEHKTVQARILAYAQEIGWMFVPREEAERRRDFAPHPDPLPASGARETGERAINASLFFGDLLHAKVRELNPKYKEAEGALVGQFQRLRADIYGNRDFLTSLRNQGKFFCAEDNRELELTSATHTYPQPGRYVVAVKVIDIFGNDTMTLVPLTVG